MAIRPDDIVNGQIAVLVGLLVVLAGYCHPDRTNRARRNSDVPGATGRTGRR